MLAMTAGGCGPASRRAASGQRLRCDLRAAARTERKTDRAAKLRSRRNGTTPSSADARSADGANGAGPSGRPTLENWDWTAPPARFSREARDARAAAAELRAMRTSIETMRVAMAEMQRNVSRSARSSMALVIMQARQIDIADYPEEFEYVVYRYNGEGELVPHTHRSSPMVRQMLPVLMKGANFRLPHGLVGYEPHENKGDNERRKKEARKEFHDRLVDQVHALLGFKPSIGSDFGKYYIKM